MCFAPKATCASMPSRPLSSGYASASDEPVEAFFATPRARERAVFAKEPDISRTCSPRSDSTRVGAEPSERSTTYMSPVVRPGSAIFITFCGLAVGGALRANGTSAARCRAARRSGGRSTHRHTETPCGSPHASTKKPVRKSRHQPGLGHSNEGEGQPRVAAASPRRRSARRTLRFLRPVGRLMRLDYYSAPSFHPRHATLICRPPPPRASFFFKPWLTPPLTPPFGSPLLAPPFVRAAMGKVSKHMKHKGHLPRRPQEGARRGEVRQVARQREARGGGPEDAGRLHCQVRHLEEVAAQVEAERRRVCVIYVRRLVL